MIKRIGGSLDAIGRWSESYAARVFHSRKTVDC